MRWPTRTISAEERLANWMFERYIESLAEFYDHGLQQDREISGSFAFHFFNTSTFVLANLAEKDARSLNAKKLEKIYSFLKGRIIGFLMERATSGQLGSDAVTIADAVAYTDVVFASERAKWVERVSSMPIDRNYNFIELYSNMSTDLAGSYVSERDETASMLYARMIQLANELPEMVTNCYSK